MTRFFCLAATVIVAMLQPAARAAAQATDRISVKYVGRIEWTDYIKGPNDFSRETVVAIVTGDVGFVPLTPTVDATVPKFKVSCRVHYQDKEQDLTADGPGLFELKWGPVKTNPKQSTYEFILACPNAMYTPAHEARWSHTMESTPQKGGMGQWPGGKVFPDVLEGTWSIPSPDTDPLNGVSGTKTLTWRLCYYHSPGCKEPAPLDPPPPETTVNIFWDLKHS